MVSPVRSYSYGPDFSNCTDMASAKKRKRGREEDDSLSARLTSLPGSQSFNTFPPVGTPALSDADSSPGDSPDDDQPFIFSSPNPTIFSTPRKLANPYKRAHFNRLSSNAPASSPMITRAPSLTFSLDTLSQASNFNGATTQACHICQHRPVNVQDLSSYIDCETCRQRTCNVCTRICEGPRCKTSISARQTLFSGATPRTAPDGEAPRGKAVCSSCCVEVGVQGHVWCKACYADDSEMEVVGLGKDKKNLANESLGRIASWLQDCGPDDMIMEEPEQAIGMNESW